MKALAFLVGSALAAASAMADVIGAGMIVLDRSADSALELVGTSTVRIATRAVFVNSTSPTSVSTSGTATLDVPTLYICGGTSFSNHSGCTGSIMHVGLACDDPVGGIRFPNTSVMTPLAAVDISSGSHNLSPGYYANGMQIRGNSTVVNFSPGLYVIRNGMRITGGAINAAGACFVIMDGAFSLSGCTSVVMSPPDSGDWTGLVIAQAPNNNSDLSLAGTTSLVVHGCIYAPGARGIFEGTSQTGGPQMGDLIIANKVRVVGTADVLVGGVDMQAVQPPHPPLAD